MSRPLCWSFCVVKQLEVESACFPIYLLSNPLNVYSDPQNSAHFSKMIDLRDHMPRFTLKMNVFPSISLETPKMCVETLRTLLVSPRQSIWGLTCLSLVEKFMFSHLCPWKHHKCVLKTLRTGLFFPRRSILRGHMPRFTLKMNIFPIYLLRNPKKCLLKPSEQCSFFQDNRFEGSHS